MTRTYAVLTIILVTAGSIAAQNQRQVLDNWDTSKGVHVFVPAPVPAAKARSRKLVKKTGSKWKVSVEDKLAKNDGNGRPVVKVAESYALRTAIGRKLVMGSNTNLKGFTTGSTEYDNYIVDSSRRYGIDPLLIYSQMHQESSFKLRATSHKGASGLMQLMPATARRFGVSKIYDPKQNIDAGVRYMRWLLDTFNGDVALALAGYNAGEGAVMKYGWSIPPYRETQEYVRRISARYNTISDPQYVHSARRVSPALAAKLENKESRPLTVFEPNALTIRLPDGKMMLVNQ